MREPIDAHDLGPEELLIQPVLRPRRGFWRAVAILMGFVLAGAVAYALQLKEGLDVTGLNEPVYWGFYIINFVFFIGMSYGGTLTSAILRATQAEWRRPITRSAEALTVMTLLVGAVQPIIDLGRPDRALNMLRHANIYSPLVWDVIGITSYLAFSCVYLYLPLLPDIAVLRERVAPKRRWLYSALSLGWQGTEKQYRRLERFITIMMVAIIPVAIMVHTVLSWVFAMTIQPFWHSTILGPFFVAGAIFSGIAALIIALAVIRKTCHFEGYFKDIHFDYLGLLLLVFSLLWAYFIVAEHLVSYYGSDPSEMRIFWDRLAGRYGWSFWIMAVCNFVIPMGVLSRRKTRTVRGTVIASAAVLVGMWFERFQIVIPSLVNPRLPLARGVYNPSLHEILITLGFMALIILLCVVFSRFFPMVSIWEIKEGERAGVERTVARLESYRPTVGK